MANAQAVNFKLTAVEKRIENERTDLLNNLDRYHRKNDLNGYKKVEKEIDTFNIMYPTMRIDLSQVAKSLQTRDKARDKSWRGIELDKHNDALISKGMLKSREDLRKREEEVRKIELRGLANK